MGELRETTTSMVNR